MADIEQIKALLGSGLSNEIVATATGCTASYISQLMAEPEFASSVVKMRSDNLQAATLRDRRMDALEDQLLTTLEAGIDLIYKPRDVISALLNINKLQRRGAPTQQAMQPHTTVVQLNIPQHLVQQNVNTHVVLSANKEVIEVDGQTMVTIQSHQLLKQLQKSALASAEATSESGVQLNDDQQREARERAERYRTTGNFLPGSEQRG